MPWPHCTQADVFLFAVGKTVTCLLGSCAPQQWGDGSNPMVGMAKEETWDADAFSLFSVFDPSLPIGPWATTSPFSIWQQLEERKGFLQSWESEEHHQLGEGEEERRGQPLWSPPPGLGDHAGSAKEWFGRGAKPLSKRQPWAAASSAMPASWYCLISLLSQKSLPKDRAKIN